MSRRRPSGFTLIELLVVVFVLLLLAALLFPLFASARAQARQAACAGHLHQIARAGLLYLADYDDRFPSLYRRPWGNSAFDLPTVLYPYLGTWDVFYCPDRQTVRSDCMDQNGRFGSLTRCMGYGYNWGSGIGGRGSGSKGDGLVRLGPDLGRAVGVTHTEVAQPSHCLFLGDTNDHNLLSLWREAMPGVRGAEGMGNPYEPLRHSRGNNFAFVDGHVQWLAFPGGAYQDGGPWVVPDMTMYSRTGHWVEAPHW